MTAARRTVRVTAALLLVAVGSGCDVRGDPAAPVEAGPLAPADGHSRPATVEHVAGQWTTTETSRRLEAVLRTILAQIAPRTAVVQTASAVLSARSSDSYLVAALVGNGDGGHGAVVVRVDPRPVSFGEHKCEPRTERYCHVRSLSDGRSVIVVDQAGEPAPADSGRVVSAELYGPDGGVTRRVRAVDSVDAHSAVFWSGGRRLPAVPLTADQAVAMVTDRSLTP